MDKIIDDFVSENNARYVKMLLDKFDLKLEPLISETGNVRKDYYFDKEKGIIAYLNKEGRTAYCSVESADIIEKKGDYRIGIFEYLNGNSISMYFAFCGLGYNIRIDIFENNVELSYFYNDKPCHPRIHIGSKDEVLFEDANGETLVYSSITIDQIMCMVDAMYQRAIRKDEFEDKELAEEKFEFMKPILKEAISNIFVSEMEERLANRR